MIRKHRTSFSAALVIFSCAVLGGMYGGQGRGPAAPSDAEMSDGMRQFTRVYAAVEENYADPVSADKSIYDGAIPGMLRTLDPHSYFLDPKAYMKTREDQRGRYYGVGMTVEAFAGHTMVKEPFFGSPAYRAGIRPGDVVAAVDGKSCDGLGIADVADMLKGPKGTQVHVRIMREGLEKALEFTITRDEIPRPSIEDSFEIEPGIAYIKISGFSSETTSHELRDALHKLNGPKLKGLVLDLRGNPGGLLNEGVAVADMFLHKGQLIVSHHGRNSPERPYSAEHGSQGNDFPLVVMMNRNSASASEIVAGAIQDHDRGLVVGETSFGKGLVQTVYSLNDNTGLALTTAKYYTPSGRLIQREFTGISLYDYYYASQEKELKNTTHEGQQVRNTDSGRLVYGGGGITPDIRLEPIKLTHFETSLEYKNAFFDFAKKYLGARATIAKDFVANDTVMGDFRRYLTDQKIAFTDAEMTDNHDYIARRIQQEVIASIYGRAEGNRVQIVADPWVRKAVEAMPQAKELADKVRRITAQRMGKED